MIFSIKGPQDRHSPQVTGNGCRQAEKPLPWVHLRQEVHLGGSGLCVVSHHTLTSDLFIYLLLLLSVVKCVNFFPMMLLLGEETDLVLVRRQLVRGCGHCDGQSVFLEHFCHTDTNCGEVLGCSHETHQSDKAKGHCSQQITWNSLNIAGRG